MPAKQLRIDLDEVSIAMHDRTGEMNWFLDVHSGEVIPLPDRALSRAEDDEAEEEAGRALREWEREEMETAARVLADPDRYVEITPGDGREAYRMMEDFIEQVREERIRDKLWVAIEGKGAFRRFKDVLFGYPDLREDWFAYESRLSREEVARWLASMDIESTWQPPSKPNPPQPPGVD